MIFSLSRVVSSQAADAPLQQPTLCEPEVFLKEDAATVYKKPWYKKWWIWALAVLAAGGGVAAVIGSGNGGSGDDAGGVTIIDGAIKIRWETE